MNQTPKRKKNQQKSTKLSGEFLGRLVLGIEDDEVKVFGATIY